MKDGICPKCQSNEVYFKKNNYGQDYANSLPYEKNPRQYGAALDSYICLSCGYVESYVSDLQALNYIKENWAKIESENPTPWKPKNAWGDE